MMELWIGVGLIMLSMAICSIGLYLNDLAKSRMKRANDLMKMLADKGMPVIPCSKCGVVMPICEAHPLKIGHYLECRVEDGQVRSTVMDLDVDTIVCKECAGKIADELTMGVKE